MLIHVDSVCFKKKPTGSEIGGIKHRFTKPGSIQEMSVPEIAAALTAGRTIQPGVTPFSAESRAMGANGTRKEDFQQQSIFGGDIDNKRADIPKATQETVAAALAGYNLKAAFMYETFNSTPEQIRIRYFTVCDEAITDKTARDRIQAALIALIPQSDPDCTNADRIFFGTDKGLIDGAGDMTAVCRKADLLALADALCPITEDTAADKPKFGETIPTGLRHGTLVGFASTVLTKYGKTEQAYDLFMQRVAQCETPKPDSEIKKIWRDACKYYDTKIITAPDYLTPDEYAAADFESPLPNIGNGGKNKGRKNPFDFEAIAAAYRRDHNYLVGVQHLSKGGLGNDTIYEYVGGVWKARSETDVKSTLAEWVLSKNALPDPAHVDKAYKLVLMSGKRKDVETFNTHENLVCFANGVYRLSDGAFLEHSPEYYFTTQLKANIPETVQETPYCDLCISNFGGADVQNLLLQIFGAAISNVNISRFKKAVLQYGKGDTGKTQLKSLAERIVGAGNYNNVDLSDLETNRFLSAAFQNVRLGGSNDMSNVRVKELKIFKQLTGGDSIQAENKGEKSFTFRYKGLLWFLANQLPLFGGDKGEHIYDRWILIPCEKPVPPDKQVKDLQDRMFAERDSLCIKALQAFQTAVADNYTFAVPECCKAANNEYRRKNSTVRTFLDECCEPFNPDNTKAAQTTGRFWNAFKAWCRDSNYYLPGKAEFRRELAAIAGVDEQELDRHTKDGNFYPFIVRADLFKELCPYDCPPL